MGQLDFQNFFLFGGREANYWNRKQMVDTELLDTGNIVGDWLLE